MSELDLKNLNELSRDELISRAAALGVNRPELLTRVELRDEIVRLTETDEQQRQRARGWLGVARDMVASVVEQRLNLPDAADLIRGVNVRLPRNVPPVATVTLAEIYAAQGHVARAVKLLDEVLTREPDHEAARELRDRLSAEVDPAAATLSEPPESQEELESESEAVFVSEPPTTPRVREEFPRSSPGYSAGDAIRHPAVFTVSDVPAAPMRDSLAPQTEVVPVTVPELRNVHIDASPVTAAEPSNFDVEVSPVITAEPIVTDEATANEGRPAEPVVLSNESRHDYLIYRRQDESVICHWSITANTWDCWFARRDGQWVLRIIQISPAAGPLVPAETVVPLPGMTGEAMFSDVTARQQLRMALGWEASGRFVPAAIGIEIAGDCPEHASIAWLPLPGPSEPAPDVLLEFARRDWQSLTMGAAS